VISKKVAALNIMKVVPVKFAATLFQRIKKVRFREAKEFDFEFIRQRRKFKGNLEMMHPFQKKEVSTTRYLFFTRRSRKTGDFLLSLRLLW